MMFSLMMRTLEKNWPNSIRSVHTSPHFHLTVLHKMETVGISGMITYLNQPREHVFSSIQHVFVEGLLCARHVSYEYEFNKNVTTPAIKSLETVGDDSTQESYCDAVCSSLQIKPLSPKRLS